MIERKYQTITDIFKGIYIYLNGDIMFKKIFKLLSRIIMSIVIIYMYNILAQPLSIVIPMNIITISVVSTLGLPGLCSLIILLVV